MIRSMVRFALVGLANTALGYSVILFMHLVVGTGLLLANVAGYAAGLVLSYHLNRSFTFASSAAHRQALPRFVLTVIACFALNLVVLEVARESMGLPFPIAQALAVASYTVAFFFASRSLVFRS